MKDWKNISNKTSWIWRTINIMIQITRLIGKESSNKVVQYNLVNPILHGFFRPKIFLGGKNDPSMLPWERIIVYSCNLADVYVSFIHFIFNFWWSCNAIDVTIFKTKRNLFETMSSQNMSLVTSHGIPNIFFGKESIHKRNV